METWVIWALVALVFIVIEIFTLGFAVICLSVGALASAAVAYFGGNGTWQFVVFAVVGALALAIVRPFLLSLFAPESEDVLTNADALVGRVAKVTEGVDAASGRVSIDGDVWRAVSENGEEFAVGEIVEIVKLNSIILTVKKKELC